MKKMILLATLMLSIGAQAAAPKCFVHITTVTDGIVKVTPLSFDLQDTTVSGMKAIGNELIANNMKMEAAQIVGASDLKLKISKKAGSNWTQISTAEVSSLAPQQTILVEATVGSTSAAISCVGM